MNPLDQLADITTPADVSMWPLAWGYWLVIVVVLTALVLSAVSIIKYRNTRREKYKAQLALNSIALQDPYFAHKVQVILKALTAHYLPPVNSQTLFGGQWLSLMLAIYKGKQPDEITQAVTAINTSLYSKNTQSNHLGVPQNDAHVTAIYDENHATVLAQNEKILAAMKDFVDTSFPCTTAEHSMALNTKATAMKQEANHV